MSKSIAKYIQKYIKLKIQSEDWKPGKKLPSENQLAIKFECSRLTARHALLPLVYSGVLIVEKGKGYVVASKSEDLLVRSITQRFDITETITEEIEEVPSEIVDELNLADKKTFVFKKTYLSHGVHIATQYTALNKDAFWEKEIAQFDKSITVALARQGVLITKNIANIKFADIAAFHDDLKNLEWKKGEAFLVEKVKSISDTIWIERTLRVYNKEKFSIDYVKFKH